MADPIFDEDFIKELLSVPVGPDTANALQTGAVQCMIDLYDRKVTRDEFCNALGACITLYGQVHKLTMLHRIRDKFESGELGIETFTKTDEYMGDLIRKQCEGVIEIVTRLQLCPSSRDKVH